MNPIVSIIVPVYQAERYLCRCVDSILCQSFTDYELLLIDDGSTDKSGTICDEYAEKDDRVRVYHKRNEGLSATRQFGIQHSKGEYTIHCDPDDWMDEKLIAGMVETADRNHSDIVICDIVWEYPNFSRLCSQMIKTQCSSDLLPLLPETLSASMCNKLIRLDCYKEGEEYFPAELKYGEDFYAFCRLISQSLVASYTGEVKYHYDKYSNEQSLSRKMNFKEVISSLDYMEKHLDKNTRKAILSMKCDAVLKAYNSEENDFDLFDGIFPDVDYRFFSLWLRHPVDRYKYIDIILKHRNMISSSKFLNFTVSICRKVKHSILQNRKK